MWDRISVTLFELILIFNVLTEFYLQDLYSGGSEFETQAGYVMLPRLVSLSSVYCDSRP